MTDFSLGQRWINNAEPDLGLGTIIEIEHRTITLLFTATEETRVYAKQNTPLSRIRFNIGDTVKCQIHGDVHVEQIEEQDGLLIYQGKDNHDTLVTVPETKLDHFLQLMLPKERLFSGQLDKNMWFQLRSQTLKQADELAHSSLYGLSGSRTSLLPHQLYIAHEVGKRHAPRVLLADEVGLGKTIEAGMILQQQLLRGQSKRILVIVPETLQHQWIVEMLRRFNLRFSLFDQERFLDEITTDPERNPLLNTQLVLCSLKFITENAQHFHAVLQGEWDMLVVDEAHHLRWTADNPDPAYTYIETLANNIKSVLLLTATPEQLGKESHFARLRLLDPKRFNDFKQFVAEEEAYQPVADIIEALLNNQSLSKAQHDLLGQYSIDVSLQANLDDETQRQKLITHLLEHQGTGRILFRNTRASIQGFPERIVYPYKLAKPDDYQEYELINQDAEEQSEGWMEFDPRLSWLNQFLKTHPNDKTLLITSHAQTALDIAQYLRVKSNIHAAVFHEGMTILERDRAAAFFADREDGSQLLVCSEIGGEGRNFQFASHLILFDLPENPDLLEQRIGRIDRIGQGDEIFIHVPYIEDTAQEVLFRWYYETLQALQELCPAASSIYQLYKDELKNCCHKRNDIEGLLKQGKQTTAELNKKLHDGRDKLLELNSFRPVEAQKIVDNLASTDKSKELEEYMSFVFDCFSVDQHVHSDTSYVLHPSSTMHEPFPCLPDEGTTITFNRNTAIHYEDMQFISWEHEMVMNIMENILLHDKGNAAMVSFQNPSIAENTLMLECLFVVDVIKDARPYLPSSLIRTVISEDRKNYSKALRPEMIEKTQEKVRQDIAKQIIKAKQSELEKLLKLSQGLAEKDSQELVKQAAIQSDEYLTTEAERLKTLQLVNPNVRDEEIEYLQQQLISIQEALVSPSLRLDSIRVLIST